MAAELLALLFAALPLLFAERLLLFVELAPCAELVLLLAELLFFAGLLFAVAFVAGLLFLDAVPLFFAEPGFFAELLLLFVVRFRPEVFACAIRGVLWTRITRRNAG